MKKLQRYYSLEFNKKSIEIGYARSSVKQICKKLDVPVSIPSL